MDSGIGIKEDNNRKLLILINMINICENTQQGGMGKGFFIVRIYLDLLGGSISIESDLGTLIDLKISYYISPVEITYTLSVNEKSASDDVHNSQNSIPLI